MKLLVVVLFLAVLSVRGFNKEERRFLKELLTRRTESNVIQDEILDCGVYNSLTTGCCNGKLFNLETHECCGKRRIDKSKYGCCDGHYFYKKTKKCCDGVIKGTFFKKTC
ncbi:hypothetical protein AC249_AIPGENE9379 [Exaiptasia diaphana]|nr:hypothetical protein AC249_AIPGENE9379 [Exaiptasia diaphana]